MYEDFTKEQLTSALKALQIENANLVKLNTSLKKEVKELKQQHSAFELDTLNRRTIRSRSTIY